MRRCENGHGGRESGEKNVAKAKEDGVGGDGEELSEVRCNMISILCRR